MNDKIINKNSYYRILSSLILITLSIFSLYINGIFLISVLSILIFVMSYEWIEITENINTFLLKFSKCIINVGLFLLSLISIKFSILFFIIIFLLNVYSNNTVKVNKLFIILGPIYICFPIIFLYQIRLLDKGLELILWFLLIVWATDIFSYICGKYYGGKKLWVSLSPNKTWSGFIFGITAGTLISVLCFYIMNFNYLYGIYFGFALSLCTQLGDLLESWIKRTHSVIDSGKLIPGHGGILDRLDGLMLSSVILYFGYSFYG
jgi:phosphatidate cytidylyltransferase